jgi:hypothetical protein
MARIKTGPIVADIAGRVGDNVFSRNAYGPYVKAYSSIQGSSAWKDIVQGYFAKAVTAWNNLPDSDVIAWAAFTKQHGLRSTFHDGYHALDPRAFWIGCSMHRQMAGLTEYPEPVAPGSLGFESLKVSMEVSAFLYLTTRGGATNSDYSTLFYSFAPQNLGVRSINSVQQINFASSPYIANSRRNFYGNYLNRFGVALPSNQKRLLVSCKVIHNASGIQVGSAHASTIGESGTNPGFFGFPSPPVANTQLTTVALTEFTSPADANITALAVYHGGSVGFLQATVYSSNNGIVGTRLINPTSRSCSTTPGYQSLPFSSPMPVQAGQTVFLAVDFQFTADVYFDSMAQTSATAPATFPGLNDPIPNLTYKPGRFGIIALTDLD